MNAIDRFFSKVWENPITGCWEWQASRDSNGYGWFGVAGRVERAHRVAYAWYYGDLPPELDHLCRNPSCVDPQHLEAVTSQENTLRGEGIAAKNARKTHCLRGHPFDVKNTHIYRKRRYCRACDRERSRQKYVSCA